MFLKQTIQLARMSTLTVALLSSSSLFALSFDVTNVKANDHLNMRISAGVGSGVVATIPADAQGVQSLGKDSKIGTTTWTLISWHGTTGWVSKHYLSPSAKKPVAKVAPTSQPQARPVARVAPTPQSQARPVTRVAPTPRPQARPVARVASAPLSQTRPVARVAAPVKAEIRTQTIKVAKKPITEKVKKIEPKVKVSKDVWVLRCGNKAPFWKVDIHPKWMKLQQAGVQTGLIITKKKQDRNRWNTAIKTVVHGQKGRNKLKLTINFAYSKRCYDTLTGSRVPYKVTTEFNGETMSGCCRAVKLTAGEVPTFESIVSR